MVTVIIKYGIKVRYLEVFTHIYYKAISTGMYTS